MNLNHGTLTNFWQTKGLKDYTVKQLHNQGKNKVCKRSFSSGSNGFLI